MILNIDEVESFFNGLRTLLDSIERLIDGPLDVEIDVRDVIFSSTHGTLGGIQLPNDCSGIGKGIDSLHNMWRHYKD